MKQNHRSAGFTLLEMSIALSIFAVVGYGLAVAVDVSRDSQITVIRRVDENRTLRTSVATLVDELRVSADAQVTVAALPDGNSRLRFMVPVAVGGASTWGVFDRRLGADAASQNRAGWTLQYTVRDGVGVDGRLNRQLVRQVLDDAFEVQREDVIADGLRSGNDAPPGFRVAMNGDVWEITFSTVGQRTGEAEITEQFHVHPRN
jgi:prepilin-type N-terminal cleavage/methylation domain-containing protein